MFSLPDQSPPQQNPARSEIVSQSVEMQIPRVLGENEKSQYLTLDLPFVGFVQPFGVLTICFLCQCSKKVHGKGKVGGRWK